MAAMAIGQFMAICQFIATSQFIINHSKQLIPTQIILQLKNMQANDVKDEILRALRSQTARFKAGKEAKKKVSNWALVSRSPPKAPNIVLPQGPLLTEKFINDLFCEQARIYYMPQHL